MHIAGLSGDASQQRQRLHQLQRVAQIVLTGENAIESEIPGSPHVLEHGIEPRRHGTPG